MEQFNRLEDCLVLPEKPEPIPVFTCPLQDRFADLFEKECANHYRDDLEIHYMPGKFVAVPPEEENYERININLMRNKSRPGLLPVTDETTIRRFLMLGNFDGIYYLGEKELAWEDIEPLTAIIDKGKGFNILKELHDISITQRNPKRDPLIFALALCARYRAGELRKEKMSKKRTSAFSESYIAYLNSLNSRALSLLKKICRITEDIFTFEKYYVMVTESSRFNNLTMGVCPALKEAAREWYYRQSPEDIALAVCRYGKRERKSHEAMFSLAHADPIKGALAAPERYFDLEQIHKYVVKRKWEIRERHSKGLHLLEAFLTINKHSPEEDVVKAIKKNGLLLEHIPSAHLNSTVVWEALLETMPLQTLLENLGGMDRIGVLNDCILVHIRQKLRDLKVIRQSRMKPLSILIAKHQYVLEGKSQNKEEEWKHDCQIIDAFEKTFFASFKNCERIIKRLCYAFDVSGSMCRPASGYPISCRTASIAMAIIAARIAYKCDVVAFSNGITVIPLCKSWTFRKTETYINKLEFSPTDCALPILWAMENKKEIDVFVVFTDNKTNYGKVHPSVALQQYRASSGIKDARLVVIGMTSTDFTIADPQDAGMLDIAGFDDTVPELICHFAKGRI